jgi:hypothetical protein
MKIGILIFLLCFMGAAGVHAPAGAAVDRSAPASQSVDETPDITWFREEMKIAPQYVEVREGILGMSWPHFIIMVFLIVFFLGALFAYYRQTTRTTRILQQLLQKEE